MLRAVLDLAPPIVFHVQEAFRRLYVQKTGIRDSHGAVTLPLGIGFPQCSAHINLETHTSSVVPACSIHTQIVLTLYPEMLCSTDSKIVIVVWTSKLDFASWFLRNPTYGDLVVKETAKSLSHFECKCLCFKLALGFLKLTWIGIVAAPCCVSASNAVPQYVELVLNGFSRTQWTVLWCIFMFLDSWLST